MDIFRIMLICCIVTTAAATCDDTTCEICKVDKCATCKSGYYLNNVETCSECSDMCLICSEFTRCDQCSEGSYRYTAPDGKSNCPVCPNRCISCTNSTQCIACKTGYYGSVCAHGCLDHCVGGECTIDGCTRGCKDGYYKDSDNVCISCLTSCKTCSKSSTCDTCNTPGRYGPECVNMCIFICPDGTCDIFTGRCGIACEEGQYLHQDGTCLACSSLCEACVTTSNTCTQCDSGHYLDGKICRPCYIGCNGCTAKYVCHSCKDGYYSWFHGCAACSAPCATCAHTNQCTSCKHGYHLVSGQCCLSTCATCTSSGHCTSCIPEYFLESQQCHQCSATCASCSSYPHCTTCKQGFYLESNNQCHQCASICATCISYTICSSCKQGYHLTSHQCCPATCATCSPSGYCISCYPGYYMESNQCHQCLATCATCISYSVCTACNQGYYLSFIQSCHVCSSACDACASYPHCTSCKQGYYMESQQCLRCSDSCATCTSYDNCASCRYGYNPESQQCHQCSSECKDQQCDSNGNCINGCSSPDRFGPKCDKTCTEALPNCLVCNTTATVVTCTLCDTGFRLESDKCVSNVTCSLECKDKQCDLDGNCTRGCASSDKYGPRCEHSCIKSFERCSKCNTHGTLTSCALCQVGYFPQSDKCVLCSDNCKDLSICNQDDGACADGCKPGWSGDTCLEICPGNCLSCLQYATNTCETCKDGFYGISCENRCGRCAANITLPKCSKDDGVCATGCATGNWGSTCNKTCGDGCLSKVCFQHNGQCFRCKSDKYGAQCDQACSESCVHPGNSSNVCRQTDGFCVFGCSPGKEGQECSGDTQAASGRAATTESTSTGTWVVIAVAIVTIVSLTIIIVFGYLRIRKLHAIYNGRKTDIPLEEIASSGQRSGSGQETSGNTYMDLALAPQTDDHLYATAQTGPDTSDNPYMDLTPVQERADHPYGTARRTGHQR